MGLKLYKEHAYNEALNEFEASYRTGGRPSALRNIGQCHRDLNHFAEAFDAYTQLLERHAAQLSGGEREALAHALEELAELSGAVAITSSEAQAAVELDGKPIGTTPLAGSKRVGLGVHHVIVTKFGL